ncbi:Inositol 2-dehydrogenase/D-chiro-inositol 3-dehydrogenase [Dyadobacter sp. CECT 9275]|uniref:Inositol 2-dehydrogenase/D-chiro-inositol 3-dehydrogenase n=1 Tax=Dyadobacter helix TaxID=2822344 RepID=A0A916JHL0_9BACT|nr:Gfo/Idh/MocA family oxidoreductase [Dyadobacter sp. CECT 9275]CAG5007943.1 Inositol 2-dehydrogenase/D-chiro-inositol 3-dehydrogenase [Dyadobacter sp. CECT 9275]
MISYDSPILVFGAGSIGERHIEILQKLGYHNIWVYRQRNLPLRNISPDTVKIITDLTCIPDINPAAAVICSPTSQHLEQTLLCIDHGIPVLVEKPLSHTTDGLDQLKSLIMQKKVLVKVAYMLRYHPFFQKIKRIAESGEAGNLLSLQSYWGEYLPDWHPWEDFRSSYAAKKQLGGGAALTLSHDLDLINWLASSAVTNWNTIKNYRSALEVSVEAGADILVSYQNGITAHAHVNFFEKSPRRWYRFVFENASFEIDYFKTEMMVFRPGKDTEVTRDIFFERNQMFEAQTLDFLRSIDHPETNYLKSVTEAEQVIKMCGP